ncbi:DUF5056 domain-containing protein [uncultured Bacteroides sp.]|uniref:DUF5056 domain-containing protein n=1 Tax=uncultured Bacteroides sp. TaxID=162156 RepID=UPI0026283E78|nr:DUF5056 domain-containing protein [uncultured Bacteroides sp.]
MTENDDKLLKQFFDENKQEIADFGFSRRVMQRLPNRARRLIFISNALCIILGSALFFLMEAWKPILSTLGTTFGQLMQVDVTSIGLPTFISIYVIAIYFIIRKLYTITFS